MNVDLSHLLAVRADAVDPPRFEPRDVVARGEQLVRRRRLLATVGSACALTLVIGGAALALDPPEDRISPAPPADLNKTTQEGSRPLSYGQGQVLHLGGRQIDTGLDFLSLDVTDDGAALTTLDGAIWFTDGTEVEQVGATLGGREYGSNGVHGSDGVVWKSQRPPDWVVNDSSGSLLARLEYPDQDKTMPELVVYDSSQRAVVARQPLDEVYDDDVSYARDPLVVGAVAGGEVFLAAQWTAAGSYLPIFRYTVDSGVLEPVDAEVFEAAIRGVPRALVIGSSAERGEVVGTLQPRDLTDHHEGPFAVNGSVLDGLFDPHTGERLDMRIPDGFESTRLWFVQWLDDDQFTLISSSPPTFTPLGDLLVCQIDAERCRVEIEFQSTWTSAPLLPGKGGLGAELALGRANGARN